MRGDGSGDGLTGVVGGSVLVVVVVLESAQGSVMVELVVMMASAVKLPTVLVCGASGPTVLWHADAAQGHGKGWWNIPCLEVCLATPWTLPSNK